MTLRYKVKFQEVGMTLLSFLAERYTYYALDDWKIQITRGNVLINEKEVNVDYPLKLNDEISFLIPEFIEPEVNREYSIVYEDEYLFAVNKSGNLPVHPAGRYRKNNLTTILLESGREESKSFIINRLDRETSGLVLFGKSQEVASKLGKLFELGKIQKTYIVYVEGNFPKELFAKGFLEKDSDSQIRKKKKFTFTKNQNSLWEVNTDFTLISNKNGISKLFAFPHTGKIHQIRATLFSLGFPVVGDKMYGSNENLFLKFIETGLCEYKFGIERQALHAHKLEFIHPITCKQILIVANEPIDMLKLGFT